MENIISLVEQYNIILLKIIDNSKNNVVFVDNENINALLNIEYNIMQNIISFVMLNYPYANCY